MPTLSTQQLYGIVSLALILSGAVIVEYMEKSYYCEPEDNVKECSRLSNSGITCYYLTAPDVTKGDRCTGGVWEELSAFVSSEPSVKIITPSNPFVSCGNTFCTSVDGITCFIHGNLLFPTPC